MLALGRIQSDETSECERATVPKVGLLRAMSGGKRQTIDGAKVYKDVPNCHRGDSGVSSLLKD